jgi:hypothetical protein
MRGREYCDLAGVLLASGSSEVVWRAAIGRAYYGLMLECREALARWGFKLPPRDQVHAFVRLRFTYPADQDLKKIGLQLDMLGHLRNKADYDLSPVPAFATDKRARRAVQDVSDALALLDAIDSDPGRQAAAIAAIKAAFPP